MGAGKSLVGRHLAALLDFSFADTDKEIEKQMSRTIKEIFKTEGEAAFRGMEREIILSHCRDPLAMVISLGGGALNDSETFKTVHASGLVVYLKSSPLNILQRVKHTDKRPLLKIEDAENYDERLLERISQLLKEREPIYAQADIVVQRDGLEAEEVAQRILAEIKKLQEAK